MFINRLLRMGRTDQSFAVAVARDESTAIVRANVETSTLGQKNGWQPANQISTGTHSG